MDKSEIIERLKNIAGHAVHTVGERPFIMSLDDGIAVHEAIELLTNCPEIPNSCNAENMEAIPVPWIEAEIKALRELDFGFTTMTAGQIEAMLNKWRKEQNGS